MCSREGTEAFKHYLGYIQRLRCCHAIPSSCIDPQTDIQDTPECELQTAEPITLTAEEFATLVRDAVFTAHNIFWAYINTVWHLIWYKWAWCLDRHFYKAKCMSRLAYPFSFPFKTKRWMLIGDFGYRFN